MNNKMYTMKAEVNSDLVHLIIFLHIALDDEDKVVNWPYTKNNNFGGMYPMSVIHRGKIKKVLEFARRAVHDNQYCRIVGAKA